MIKNFDNWNKIKKKLDSENKKYFFKQWDIWRVSFWLNIWNESCGKGEKFRRPVLIIKKLSWNSCIVLPLTTKIKTWTWFEKFDFAWVESVAMLYQIRMINTNRFQHRLWTLDEKDFDKIKEKLKLLLEL